MSLDINTPKGQRALRLGRRGIALFEQRFPDLKLNETPQDKPSICDGMIYRKTEPNETLVAVAEVKARDDMDLALFCGERKSEWLITDEKLQCNRQLAKQLCVPLVGLLYLSRDDVLLVQRIFNADGTEATAIRTRTTRTQATVNGGTAVRLNAFITVREAAGRLLKAGQGQARLSVNPHDPALVAIERARSQSVREWLTHYDKQAAA